MRVDYYHLACLTQYVPARCVPGSPSAFVALRAHVCGLSTCLLRFLSFNNNSSSFRFAFFVSLAICSQLQTNIIVSANVLFLSLIATKREPPWRYFAT